MQTELLHDYDPDDVSDAEHEMDFSSMLTDLLDDEEGTGNETLRTPLLSSQPAPAASKPFTLKSNAVKEARVMKPNADLEDFILALPDHQLVFHPYYYDKELLESLEVDDPVRIRIENLKAKRSPKRRKGVAKPNYRSEFLEKISQQDKIQYDEIMEEWRRQLFAKGEKHSKGGRPRIASEVEWKAIKELYSPYSFGFTRISNLLSSKKVSREDSMITVLVLKNAGWTDDEVQNLITRIFEGKSKMSPSQVSRLWRMERWN